MSRQLFPEIIANRFYGYISDHIENYKQRVDFEVDSATLPVFVDQIGKLRDLFHKLINSINDENIENAQKTGAKLNAVLSKYPGPRDFWELVFKSWDNVNDARHYFDQKGQVNFSLADYKKTLKGICAFIAIYSDTSVPEKIKSFYTPEVAYAKLKQDVLPETHTAKTDVGLLEAQLTERQKEVWNIPDTRLPILFVLDVSLSMNYENRIEDLFTGVKYFFKSIHSNEVTNDSVELGIITFGHEVKQLLEFSSIDRAEQTFNQLTLEADGKSTMLGQAMLKALSLTIDVKKFYSDSGISYHQPWIVLITDCDSQGIDNYKEAAKIVSKKISNEKIVLFPIIVGSGDLEILMEFAPLRDAVRMKDKKFPEFFNWLKESALFIAKSRPDEVKPRPKTDEWQVIRQ